MTDALDGSYYAQGLVVMARPRQVGSRITMGFRVCEAYTAENARMIADALNMYDDFEDAGAVRHRDA